MTGLSEYERRQTREALADFPQAGMQSESGRKPRRETHDPTLGRTWPGLEGKPSANPDDRGILSGAGGECREACVPERDPRVDPSPGDVLRRGDVTRRIVVTAPTYVQALEFHRDGFTRSVLPRIGQWLKWAAKAEVDNGV